MVTEIRKFAHNLGPSSGVISPELFEALGRLEHEAGDFEVTGDELDMSPERKLEFNVRSRVYAAKQKTHHGSTSLLVHLKRSLERRLGEVQHDANVVIGGLVKLCDLGRRFERRRMSRLSRKVGGASGRIGHGVAVDKWEVFTKNNVRRVPTETAAHNIGKNGVPFILATGGSWNLKVGGGGL